MKAFAFILIFHVVILSVISNASCEDLSTGPTIVAWPNFKPIPAAKKLHDWITTETAIGETVVMYLAYHTAAQRQAISDMYDRYFPIVNKVEGKFEPSFVRDVQAAIAEPDYGTSSNVADMRTDKALYLAQQLELSFRDNKAIKKDYGYMSIICTSTGDLLRNITSAFSSNHVNLFGRTLQERLRKELWNKDLREFLLYILEEPLRLNNEVDPAKTQKYLSAIPEEEGNCAKNKLLRDLLAKESFAQIKAVGDQYQTTKQHPAIDNIDKNCKGLVGDAFTRVFKFAMNNGEYFAEQIQDYFDGKGDINNAGPVTVISRSEIDLADIRTAYKKKYNKDLDTAFETEVDDTLKRIQSHKGVVGTIVISGEGVPIRSTLDNSMTVHYAAVITEIIEKTRNGVRDLDPTNELTILRIRTKKHEIMIAPDAEFIMIVIQEPVE